MSWQEYHQKLMDRKPRGLYVKALALFDGKVGRAVDLGSGSGAETVDLLAKNWKVLAVDQEAAELMASHKHLQIKDGY